MMDGTSTRQVSKIVQTPAGKSLRESKHESNTKCEGRVQGNVGVQAVRKQNWGYNYRSSINLDPPGKVRVNAPDWGAKCGLSSSRFIPTGMGSGEVVRIGSGDEMGEYDGDESWEWMFGNVACGEMCPSGYPRPRTE
jgi:hypothetical protein